MIACLAVLFLLLAPSAVAQGVQQMVMAAGAPVERLVLPDIPVTDASGRQQGIVSRFAGEGALLIAFSYTDCLTLCPITHAILRGVDEGLSGPDAPPLTILTISLDPVRDTPARLADAAQQLGASQRWVWLAASPADTPALLSAMGAPPGPPEAHDPLFLMGDMASGDFRRIAGLPDPDEILSLVARR